MKIENTEIKLPKTDNLNSEYIEQALTERGIDFVRWAIVAVDSENYILNVSNKVFC